MLLFLRVISTHHQNLPLLSYHFRVATNVNDGVGGNPSTHKDVFYFSDVMQITISNLLSEDKKMQNMLEKQEIRLYFS